MFLGVKKKKSGNDSKSFSNQLWQVAGENVPGDTLGFPEYFPWKWWPQLEMDFWNDLRQHFLADQLGCKYKLIEQTKGLLRIAFSHSDWWVTWMEQILQPMHFDMPCDIQSVTGACSWGANTGGKNEQRKVQLAIFQNGSGCLKAKGCSKLKKPFWFKNMVWEMDMVNGHPPHRNISKLPNWAPGINLFGDLLRY